VNSELAFINRNVAFVTISNKSGITITFVACGNILAASIERTFVGSCYTLINLFMTMTAVSVKSSVTFAGEPGSLLSVTSRFRSTGSIRITVVKIIGAIIWLFTSGLSQFRQIRVVHHGPILVTLFSNFTNDCFEGMSPIAGGFILGVINKSTTDNTGVSGALDSSLSNFSEMRKLLSDSIPVVNSRKMII
jgi:hypothetical protein